MNMVCKHLVIRALAISMPDFTEVLSSVWGVHTQSRGCHKANVCCTPRLSSYFPARKQRARAQSPHVDQSLLVLFFLRATAGWSRSSTGHLGLWEPGCSWLEGSGKADPSGPGGRKPGTAFSGALSLRGYFS